MILDVRLSFSTINKMLMKFWMCIFSIIHYDTSLKQEGVLRLKFDINLVENMFQTVNSNDSMKKATNI